MRREYIAMLNDLCMQEPRSGFHFPADVPVTLEVIAETLKEYPFLLGDACAKHEHEIADAIVFGDETEVGRMIVALLKQEVPGTILSDLRDRSDQLHHERQMDREYERGCVS